jgi:hypothetical protein
MYNYLLKNTFGEVINTTNQNSLDLAIEFFSKIKQITKKDLLKIYIVKKA